jgi:hypothetical protein
MARAKTKERITVSLTRESVKFLRAQRIVAQSPSMSALIEEIVAGLQARMEMSKLDESMRAYYDSFGESDIREEAAWGALGQEALASLTEVSEHQPKLTGARS